MSHVILLRNVRITQQAARNAAKSLGWQVSETNQERVQFYDRSEHVGLTVKLPGWQFPVVVKDSGEVAYDNYHGSWGNSVEVSRLTGLAMLDMQGESLSSVIVTESAGELIFETS